MGTLFKVFKILAFVSFKRSGISKNSHASDSEEFKVFNTSKIENLFFKQTCTVGKTTKTTKKETLINKK